MPLSYPGGTLAEHRACRHDAVAFDVSHLGTVRVAGDDAFDRLQQTLSNDLRKVAPGRAQYTHLLDDADGSVLDDIIVWWLSDDTFDVMPNASNTARVREAVGGEDTTADAGRDRRPGTERPAPPGGRGTRGRRRAAVRGVGFSLGRCPVHGRRDRLHRRGRGRVRRARRGRAAVLGGGARQRRRAGRARGPRHAAARGRASRCTATSSGRGSRRCRPAWAGWSGGTRATFRGRRALERERAAGRTRLLAGARHRRSPATARRTPTVLADGPMRSARSRAGTSRPMLGRGHRPGLRRAPTPRWRTATRSERRGTRPAPGGRGSVRLRSSRAGRAAPTPDCDIERDGAVGGYIPHTDDRGRRHARVPRAVVARRAVRRRPGRAAPGGAGWTSAPGRPEPDVLAHMEDLAGRQPARSDATWSASPGRAPTTTRSRRSPARSPAARSSSPRTRPTSPRWPRACSRPCSSSRPWWPASSGLPVANASLYDGAAAAGRGGQPGRGGLGAPGRVAVGRGQPALARGAGDLRRGHRPPARRRAAAPTAPPTGRPSPSTTSAIRRASWWSPTPTTSGASRTWPRPAPSCDRSRRAARGGASTRCAPASCAVAGGVGRRRGGGGGPGPRDAARLRRPVPRPVRLHRRPRAPPARPPRGRDRRRRGPARLRHDAAGPRAGHPAREGDLQRLHQPDPHGRDRRHPARLAGHVGPGRGGPALRRAAPATAGEALLGVAGVEPLATAAGAARVRRCGCRSAPTWWSSAWPTRASWPASPSTPATPTGDATAAGGRDRAPDPGRDRRLRRRLRQGGAVTVLGTTRYR